MCKKVPGTVRRVSHAEEAQKMVSHHHAQPRHICVVSVYSTPLGPPAAGGPCTHTCGSTAEQAGPWCTRSMSTRPPRPPRRQLARRLPRMPLPPSQAKPRAVYVDRLPAWPHASAVECGLGPHLVAGQDRWGPLAVHWRAQAPTRGATFGSSRALVLFSSADACVALQDLNGMAHGQGQAHRQVGQRRTGAGEQAIMAVGARG